MSEEYDYYKVDVTKKSYTNVYIKVPKGELVSFGHRKLIKEATVKTVTKYDWDDYGWENDLEVDGVSKVSEKEATEYVCCDAHYFKSL
jgi:hypothetical protein